MSIGIEINTSPSILFLDEPTSGLDSFGAFVVVNILKDLADAGCTVLCTIHQPSSEVFHLFDRTMLLSEGRTLYDGPVSKLPAYFASLSLPVPEETNPADHVMFVMQTLEREKLLAMCDDHGKLAPQTDPHAVPHDVALTTANLEGGLRRSQAGFFTQLATLGRREIQNVLRDKGELGARFGITIGLNLLFGLLFLNIGDTSRFVSSPHHHLPLLRISLLGLARLARHALPVGHGVG